MDTKNLLENTFRQTRKLVQATQQAGEDAFTYGRKKVEEGIANTKELLRKKKETERILDEARERYQRAVVQFETEREASLEESSRLDILEQSIINHEFIRFGHLYECAVNRTLQLQTESGHASLAFEVPALQPGSAIHPSIKGIAAGGAAAAATVGMTALFGTASTGAAIAGLHGAAAVGATLSALGGGALSAGGLGIVGGLAVASGAFVIPAIAIGTYFWGTDIQKNYDNALRYRDEVNAAVSVLDEEREKFKEARRFATTLHHDLSLERIALGTMLDIFEQSLSTGHTKTAYELCGKLVFLMGQSMTLSYPMDSPTGKRASETEQEIHMAAFGGLQQKFGAYIASMEEIYRKEAESFLAAQEESLRQKHPETIVRPLKNEEIRLLLENTFRSMAREEICIISPWVSNWNMEDLMEIALERGVTIKLLYGMLDENASHSHEERHAHTKERVEQLCRRFARFGEKFRTKEGNTHAKLLIADNRYYYIGSYNLMSFRGDYETEEKLHEEIGDYSENPRMIAFYKTHYFDF